MKPSNMKNHLRNASDISFKDIIKGAAKLTGNTVSLSFKALGATIYIANQVVSAGLKVGTAAFNEVKDGYTETDELLSSKDQEDTVTYSNSRDKPTDNRNPQTEFDFD